MSTARKDIVLTTNEAMEYLRISRPTFLKYVHLGRIKAIKAGKGWRILQSELNQFLRGEVEQRMETPALSVNTYPEKSSSERPVVVQSLPPPILIRKEIV